MLSICICVYNNWNLTRTCLSDLSKLEDTEVIIVDNGSSDQTQENLSKKSCVLPENFKYIRVEENLGFVRGSNLAYQNASGQYILFLNNDVKVKERFSDWTQLLINSIDNDHESIVGPTGGLLDSNFNFIRETSNYVESKFFYMSGWCLAGKKETFEKLREVLADGKMTNGPFSEFVFSYFEDGDLSWRAKKLGIDLRVVGVPVFHFGRMTGKKLNLPGMYSESRRRFIEKWAGKI